MKGFSQDFIDKVKAKGLKITESPNKPFNPYDTSYKPVLSKSKETVTEGKKQGKKHYSNTEKDFIEWVLKESGYPYVKEYRFAPPRRFRFDFSIVHPDYKIAVEYEGIYSEKSRHTSMKGYSKDTEKYNLSVIQGWRVLRYTSLTYKQFANDLKELLAKIG